MNGIPFYLDTYASNYRIVRALFQTHQERERRPIGFFSHSLNKAERNYNAPERECFAVVWALLNLRPYIMYERFTVQSDQQSLHSWLTITESSGILMRLRLRLEEFDFKVKYKSGK